MTQNVTNVGETPPQLYIDIVIPTLVMLTMFLLNAIIFYFIIKKRKSILEHDHETEEYEELATTSAHATAAVELGCRAPMQSIELEQL